MIKTIISVIIGNIIFFGGLWLWNIISGLIDHHKISKIMEKDRLEREAH